MNLITLYMFAYITCTLVLILDYAILQHRIKRHTRLLAYALVGGMIIGQILLPT